MWVSLLIFNVTQFPSQYVRWLTYYLILEAYVVILFIADAFLSYFKGYITFHVMQINFDGKAVVYSIRGSLFKF